MNTTINPHQGVTMKSSTAEISSIIGTSMDGGFYAGRIRIGAQVFALIVALKADGEHADIKWINNSQDVPGAMAYDDGLANTKAMAAAGSDLAKWALDLRIAGHDDWYLPSQDELEIIYRNLKPTTVANWCYTRSGINLSAVEPTRPYTPDSPEQTLAEAFQSDGEQAFDDSMYWSSTQHASDSCYAWCQYFTNGNQGLTIKTIELRARAVRRLPI
jgi:hypothetical protein